jgi:membrane protease YdiL (CAAX protease family)
MGKISKIILILIIAVGTVEAQNSFDEREILAFTWTSAAPQIISSLETVASKSEVFPYVFMGTSYTQHFSQYSISTTDALWDTGILTGLGAGYIVNDIFLDDPIIKAVSFNLFREYSMFTTYEIYRNLRTGSGYGNYTNAFNLPQLLLSPFDPDALMHWYVYGPLLCATAYVIGDAIINVNKKAIWQTGTCYIGKTEISPVLGIPVMLTAYVAQFSIIGACEESLYRGTYYDAMKTWWGEWPAKIIDGLWYSASHMPQQITDLNKTNLPLFLIKTSLSVGETMWQQVVYDWAGLKSAVALHAWLGFIVFYCDWLSNAGVPDESISGFSFAANGSGLIIKYSY